ncbi:type II secretion system inner membrane protein GspF [Ponticaulis sp.]|uniref:type II secretion system inner membrane protein GspF n=1 Tax=Ponticaulis sp. TaxID=2020902 RepID=UPI000C59EA60|nr:type II secretion system inner membrane protein GspF [Ponticaulis sp.]MAF59068.1 type II secretion system protein GspF [Ponticaulis sp.]MBN04391.1 type II secretion system protein GspF [Ponticaulis sp.]
MPTFDYVALSPEGKREKGVIAADSARAARRELRVRQMTPLKLEEAKEKPKSALSSLSAASVSQSDLLLITRQWAIMIGSGTPVEESIAAAAAQAEKPGVRKTLLAIRNSVTEGYRLSEALGEHPKVFNGLYRSIVAAGEASGDLGAVLERLAEYLERSRKVRQTVQTALIYPMVLAFTALLVMVGLMTFVVPRVVEQFTTMNQELPMLTRIVIGISDVLQNYGLIILAVIVAAIFGLTRLFALPKVKRVVDGIMLKLPVIGTMLTQVNTARFARTLSTLLGNGAPVLESLTAARSSLGNLVFQNAVSDIIVKVREGAGISRAMKSTGVFPALITQLSSSGEASGQLPDMLLRGAKYLEDEFEAATKVALGLLEPLIILVLGGMVALVVLSIMLPILQLNSFVIG